MIGFLKSSIPHDGLCLVAECQRDMVDWSLAIGEVVKRGLSGLEKRYRTVNDASLSCMYVQYIKVTALSFLENGKSSSHKWGCFSFA